MSKPNPDEEMTDERSISRQTIFTDPFLEYPICPPTPASDVDPGNYTEVEFGNKHVCAHRELAEELAPNSKSTYRQHLDIAGERAVSEWLGIPPNIQVHNIYEEDSGYDIKIAEGDETLFQIKVKTTQKAEPEATVEQYQAEKADVFVLCRTNGGGDQVEIVGYALSLAVKAYGNHPNQYKYRIVPDYLHPTTDMKITPGDIRNGI